MNACGYDTITASSRLLSGKHAYSDYRYFEFRSGAKVGTGTTEMFDADGDGIYEVTLGLVSGDTQIEYKYINGDSWSDGHDDNLTACTASNSSGNRTYTVPYVNDTLPVYHLSSCDENMPIDPLIDARHFLSGDDVQTWVLVNRHSVGTGDEYVIGATTPGWYWFWQVPWGV